MDLAEIVFNFISLFICVQITLSLKFDEKDQAWAEWHHHDVPSSEDDVTCPVLTKPNIIFIFFDDLGWNDIGYHNPDIFTPNLDQLALEGIRLEQNYVATICSPSRSALMTGMYPYHIGRQGSMPFTPNALSGLTLSRKLLSEYLQELNYTTHLVGKWHLGVCNPAYLPLNRGFHTQYGLLNGGSYNHAHTDCLEPFEYDFFENDTANMDLTLVGNIFQMDLYHKRAIEIIEDHARTSLPESPMFLYLAFTSPHFPVEAPPEYLDMYPNVDDTEKRRSFMGMVSHMDNVVGGIVRALIDAGLYDNSIIVAMSDNGAHTSRYVEPFLPFYGGGSNDPLKGQKFDLDEGGVRVPAFVHSPLLNHLAGSISSKMIHVVDWFATLLTLAGGQAENYPELSDIDGLNQYESLFCDQDPVRSAFVYGLKNETVDGVTFAMGAIRYGRWKLINTDGPDPLLPVGSFMLYDLQEDPNETTDLFEARPDVAALMMEKFEEAASSMVPEDSAGYAEGEDMKLAIDANGAQFTDFCNLDGSVKRSTNPENAASSYCCPAISLLITVAFLMWTSVVSISEEL